MKKFKENKNIGDIKIKDNIKETNDNNIEKEYSIFNDERSIYKKEKLKKVDELNKKIINELISNIGHVYKYLSDIIANLFVLHESTVYKSNTNEIANSIYKDIHSILQNYPVKDKNANFYHSLYKNIYNLVNKYKSAIDKAKANKIVSECNILFNI